MVLLFVALLLFSDKASKQTNQKFWTRLRSSNVSFLLHFRVEKLTVTFDVFNAEISSLFGRKGGEPQTQPAPETPKEPKCTLDQFTIENYSQTKSIFLAYLLS